jgi:predicted ATP-dependent Lon-type protease
MTSTPAAASEMDHLDQLGAKAFAGFLVRKDLVRKDLVRKYSRQYPVPNYLVEFLLGRYCASTAPAEIEEGLLIMENARCQLHTRPANFIAAGHPLAIGKL